MAFIAHTGLDNNLIVTVYIVMAYIAHTDLDNNLIVMACIVMAYTNLDNNLLCRNKSLSECVLTDLALLRGHEHLKNPNSMHGV